MALNDIILNAGEVIVISSDSTLGILPASGGVALNFGTVVLVNDLSNKTTVGQSVQFDKTKAIPFIIISGQTYYTVKEDDISFYEPPVT